MFMGELVSLIWDKPVTPDDSWSQKKKSIKIFGENKDPHVSEVRKSDLELDL